MYWTLNNIEKHTFCLHTSMKWIHLIEQFEKFISFLKKKKVLATNIMVTTNHKIKFTLNRLVSVLRYYTGQILYDTTTQWAWHELEGLQSLVEVYLGGSFSLSSRKHKADCTNIAEVAP